MHVSKHVGEYLARGLNASEETEENNNPGDGQAAQDRQMHFSKVPNVIRDVEHIVPTTMNQFVIISNDIYKRNSIKKTGILKI